MVKMIIIENKMEVLIVILSILLVLLGNKIEGILLQVYYVLLFLLFLANVQVLRKTSQKIVPLCVAVFLATLFFVLVENALPLCWTLPLLLTSSAITTLVSITTRSPALSILAMILLGVALILTTTSFGGSLPVKEAAFESIPPLLTIY